MTVGGHVGRSGVWSWVCCGCVRPSVIRSQVYLCIGRVGPVVRSVPGHCRLFLRFTAMVAGQLPAATPQRAPG